MTSQYAQAFAALFLPPIGLALSQVNTASDPWSLWADRGVLVIVCATSWALIKDLLKQSREERRLYDSTISAVHEVLLSVVEKNNTVLTQVKDGIEGLENRSLCIQETRDEVEREPRRRSR